MEESVDFNQILKKVEASVGDQGFVSVEISGYATKKDRERRSRGTNLRAQVFQDPVDFDCLKSTGIYALERTIGEDTIDLYYTEDSVEYRTSLPLSELPKYFSDLIKTPIVEELREFMSRKLESLRRGAEYKREDLKKSEEEFNRFNQLLEQIKTE